MILAICNSGQYELSAYSEVKKIIEARDIEIVSYCQDKCLNNDYLSFRSNSNSDNFIVSINKNEYEVDKFKSIWYMKPKLPNKLLRYKPHEFAHFIHRQFTAVRQGLWLVCGNKNWVSNPISMDLAENKIFQLNQARETGFKIPKTLVSSNPKEIRSFYKNNERTIIKSLSPTIIIDYVILTTEITIENANNLFQAKYAPSIYQELVKKKYELRITVVDGEIFAAKIYSQEDVATSIDWRNQPKFNDYSVKMEPTVLPKQLERMILNYMAKMNLRFGCIDMIVTPNDEYIFLEINPNGQWYFVQLNTGLEIAKSIARVLCEPY